MLKWPCRAFKPRLLPGCGYMHAREVKFRGRSHPAKLLAKRKPPTDRMDEKCQTTSQSCDDRVHPVSQYAGALWENVVRVRALFLEWKLSNHCSAAQPRHYGGPARIISAGRAGKLNAWRLCSLTAGIREHCSLSLRYISTAQEDVPCGDYNDVAPKRQ